MSSERLITWESIILDQLPANDWVLRCFNQVSSTMEIARELLDQVSPETPGLILSSRQTAGRGRQGRSWESAHEGFYGTYVFATNKKLSEMAGFSLVVGCLVFDLLSALGCRVGLKWPNDIITPEGKKISGTLIEVISHKNLTFVLTGIGINIEAEPSANLEATSIQELSGNKCFAPDLAVRLSPQLFAAWLKFCASGFLPFREIWLAKALFQGREFAVETGSGTVRGEFVGVSEQGCLLLKRVEDVVTVSGGHVTEIR